MLDYVAGPIPEKIAKIRADRMREDAERPRQRPREKLIFTAADRSTLWRRLTKRTRRLRITSGNQVIEESNPKGWPQPLIEEAADV